MTAAVIQARMGSKRFPGKVMKNIDNRPLISYMIERVKKSKLINQIIIATTVLRQDDVIIDWCKENKINYYRGSVSDVLSRYFNTSKEYNIKTIVRLTADCPLIDPLIIDKVVSKYFFNLIDVLKIFLSYSSIFCSAFNQNISSSSRFRNLRT